MRRPHWPQRRLLWRLVRGRSDGRRREQPIGRRTFARIERWINAIDKAAAGLLGGGWIVTELYGDQMVTTDSGEIYRANGMCGCKAFKNGQPCKHRALAKLIENRHEAEAAKPASRVPRIVRSVESDRTGQRYTVVRCNVWAI